MVEDKALSPACLLPRTVWSFMFQFFKGENSMPNCEKVHISQETEHFRLMYPGRAPCPLGFLWFIVSLYP